MKLQKVQAIDGFSKFLDNKNKTMYSSLVLPVLKKKIAKDINLKMISAQIRKNLLEVANKHNGKVRIIGKPRYYPTGNWDDADALYSFITLDLWGEDADILEKGVIEYRINGYFNMKYEELLRNNLYRLGVHVRHSTLDEDRKQKVDLIIYQEGLKIGVSVFKSSNETALYKLRGRNANQFKVRLAYNVYKYGTPARISNVKKWWRDCEQGENIIHIQDDNFKYII